MPPDQKKAGFHLLVRPDVRQAMIDLAAEHDVTVAQVFEAVWHVAAGFASHPDGARLLHDHAAARDFGRYAAAKVAEHQTVVVEDLSEFDGVASSMVDLRHHLAAIEARDASRE